MYTHILAKYELVMNTFNWGMLNSFIGHALSPSTLELAATASVKKGSQN